MSDDEKQTDPKLRKIMDEAIRKACRKIGMSEQGEQFIREGRSWRYVREWLKRNTIWRPAEGAAGEDGDAEPRAEAPASIDAAAIYARFNNPPKKKKEPRADDDDDGEPEAAAPAPSRADNGIDADAIYARFNNPPKKSGQTE